MLNFEHPEKDDLVRFKPWFSSQKLRMGDYSLGFQYMWHKALAPDYAVFGGCLILRELYAGKYFFYYPLSPDGDRAQETAAIEEIERHCRDTDTKLHFTNVPKSRVADLVLRYGASVTVTDVRRWRDYLYEADAFRLYEGKKRAGQRNHVHKFMRLYPDWTFRAYEKKDEGAVAAFLKEYESVQLEKEDRIADEELAEVYEILPDLERFGLFGGILTAGGKIVAFSAGERCGDTVIVHIEKALRGAEGAYPMVAQQFARMFCTDGVNYLNRMDDAGDLGLRKSKLQYGPCELVDKYNVTPARAIDGVSHLPEIESERLILRPVGEEDAKRYAELASDVARNKWWGYDWRSDVTGIPDDGYFLALAQDDFHHRREMPLGVYRREDGALLGEAVLHRFGYAQEAEIGARLFSEYEGMGYAREAVRAYTDYAFSKMGIERMEAKCYRENVRSYRMLEGAGMRHCGEDETYFYFYRTAEM